MSVAEIRAVTPLAETLAAVRAATETVTVLVVRSDLPAVERAMLIAAVGPLAIELAPARRLCAIEVADGAAADDVAAALRFLSGANSTTGQVLAIA